MDEAEARAQCWLRNQRYEDIEPRCGGPHEQGPPDFVVNGKIAVEVTWLNELTEFGSGGEKPERETERRIRDLIEEKLNSGDLQKWSRSSGMNWDIYCDYDYSRGWSKVQRKAMKVFVREALKPLSQPYCGKTIAALFRRHFEDMNEGLPLKDAFVVEADSQVCAHIWLNLGTKLELRGYGTLANRVPRALLVQVSSGEGSTVNAEMYKGIRHALKKKSERVRSKGNFHEYDSWWLVLVDHELVFENPEGVQLQNRAGVPDHEFGFWDGAKYCDWERVVLVSGGLWVGEPWHFDLHHADKRTGQS